MRQVILTGWRGEDEFPVEIELRGAALALANEWGVPPDDMPSFYRVTITETQAAQLASDSPLPEAREWQIVFQRLYHFKT